MISVTDPLFLFGIGVALVGCGAVGTTLEACRSMLAIPRGPDAITGPTPLLAMLFILLVDIGIIAGGLWVAVAVAGGARG
ncbi:hypothetical protein [uncultured Sphingomonas sp.]|uniref:hypothetical protein n=1 Tax=uncultured Sphingomonas sp. TaxID=158754 RepID=UPI0025EA6A43|nr:hypothetical protein [uncultured Sphingomonas sp.]